MPSNSFTKRVSSTISSTKARNFQLSVYHQEPDSKIDDEVMRALRPVVMLVRNASLKTCLLVAGCKTPVLRSPGRKVLRAQLDVIGAD